MYETTKRDNTYFVAVKVFLYDDNEKFLIMNDGFGEWDIPGGRIRENEFDTPIEDVIKRKLPEELGSDFEFKLNKRPIVTMRHKRNEANMDGVEVKIFAVGYEAKLVSGKVELTSHHTEMRWVDPKTFKPEEYFNGGWLKGLQEYLAIKNFD